MKIDIQKTVPDYVIKVANILHNNGYKAYLVGGAVRDIIIGKTPKDYDIATDATPDQMDHIFDRCITTNARFGTVLVIMESNDLERFDVEVTTFRKEENYLKGRWPSKVEFTDDIIQDLSRRDFTINAMALNLIENNESDKDNLIDPFGGLDDLDKGIIRAVNDPIDRFSEDGLRSYKACRLASELNFEIDEQTFNAIKATLDIAKQISIERIRDEFVKCVKNSFKPSKGIELMRHSGLLSIFLPELLDIIGITQPEYHDDDVYTHSLKVMDLAQDSVKIAALLHDIGKAKTRSVGEDGRVHFYGHDQVGAIMAENIMKRMKFSNDEIKQVSVLIRWHMFYYPSAQWRQDNPNKSFNEEEVQSGGWSDSAVRRFIKNVGEEYIDDLFRLRIADASSNKKNKFDVAEIELLQNRIAKIKSEDMVLKVTDLQINGNDLKNIGIPAGPKVGEILNKLLDYVIEDPSLNSKEKLMELAGVITGDDKK